MAIPHFDSCRLAPTRGRAIMLLAALFTFCFAAYTFTASADFFSNGDTTIRIQMAENFLGGHHNLDGWKLQYPKHMKKEYFDPRIWSCKGNKVCSTYLLGQPLAIMPLEIVGRAITVHERWPYGPGVYTFDRLVGPLFGALEVTLFFAFAVRLGYGVRRSLLMAAILAFATSVWPDEQSVLEHTEVAFFLLLGMYFVYRFREQGAGLPYLGYAGMAVGGAAITRYQDALVGFLGVCVYIVWPGGPAAGVRTRLKWLVVLGLGLAPFALIDMSWSWVRFGSPFASGHHETVFGYPPWKGAAGLLLSPGKGLLWYSPTVLLLAVAGVPFTRRFPALAAGSAVIFVGFVFLYGNVTYWHGDPAWGPRYIYPALPLLTLPLGELFRRRIRMAPLVWALTALAVASGLTVQVAAVSVSQWRSWYKVIAYEENQGQEWQWIAGRYRYFWDAHESPLYFQLHGLYQLSYDTIRHSHKYDLVPPDEDPILDRMTIDYAINQWNFWWASNEYNWWMGEQKIALSLAVLISLMLASGLYLGAEAGGLFASSVAQPRVEPLPEAA